MKSAFLVLLLFSQQHQSACYTRKVKLCSIENKCSKVDKFEVPEKNNVHSTPGKNFKRRKKRIFSHRSGQIVNKSKTVACSEQEAKFSLMR
jgi:hypothetical protein